MGFLKEIEDCVIDSIDIGNLSISEYFYGCDVLEYIELPCVEALEFLIVKSKIMLGVLLNEDMSSRKDSRIFYIERRVVLLEALLKEIKN